MAREPLSLDVRAKPGGLDTSGLNSQQNSAELRQPLPRDVVQFQQLMKAPEPEASQLPSGPFALFAQGALRGVQGTPHRVQTPAAAAATSDPVRDVLQGLVQRLLVGDGREGRRSVRIGLTDEAMPGVDVEVFQESGAWVAVLNAEIPAHLSVWLSLPSRWHKNSPRPCKALPSGVSSPLRMCPTWRSCR
jgi:hypothetical protein